MSGYFYRVSVYFDTVDFFLGIRLGLHTFKCRGEVVPGVRKSGRRFRRSVPDVLTPAYLFSYWEAVGITGSDSDWPSSKLSIQAIQCQ